jgi:hypothetical protein
LGLAWRPNAPRSADYRALGTHLVDTCREALDVSEVRHLRPERLASGGLTES